MASKKEVQRFLDNQKSIQFYPIARKVFNTVFGAMSKEEFDKATNNLILMVLHEGAIAQVMHFPRKGKIKVLQLTIPTKAPLPVLCYIIAHEAGHVLQGRNWMKSDGQKLEEDAEDYARRLGFPRTPSIDRWIKKYRTKF